MEPDITLLRPGSGADRAGVGSLPTDLLHQAVWRLRTLAMLYAFVFFMAGVFPMLVLPAERARLGSSFIQWGPSLIAIGGALVVAVVVGRKGVSVAIAMKIGLAFEAVGSYGIALAEFIDPRPLTPGVVPTPVGLSWVAVWTLLFTIVIPSPPRRALTAAVVSVSAVPVTMLALMAAHLTPIRLTASEFFFGMVFPYVLVVCMAYVGARVVYALGTEIRKARELGSYRLEEKLGQGGMGEVWRATHRLLARPAAIKLMRGTPRTDAGPGRSRDAVQRFTREAQVIAGLRSPHTVNLFDFGVDSDGTFYYVMELLDGMDTENLVRRFGPLPASRVIHVLRQMCHSLSEAESHGLVHRDIKPANVFLCHYGEEYDFVKVLDFGIVKIGAEAPVVDRELTGEQTMPGTPAFMAPEQAMGGTVDGRTDIYAMGCVAYWLLTGQLVFEAASPVALLMHHVRTPPTAPSARSAFPVSPALDALVLACLAKDPAARPQSARELVRRLDAIDTGDPWGPDDASAWWERRRSRTGLSTAALAIGSAGDEATEPGPDIAPP